MKGTTSGHIHFTCIRLVKEKREAVVTEAIRHYNANSGKSINVLGDIMVQRRGETNPVAEIIKAATSTRTAWTWDSANGIQGLRTDEQFQTMTASGAAGENLTTNNVQLQQMEKELRDTKTLLTRYQLEEQRAMDMVSAINASFTRSQSSVHNETTAPTHQSMQDKLAESESKINELEAKLQNKDKELAEAKKTQRPPTANDLMAKRPGQESIGDLKTKLRTVNCNVDRLEAQLATATSTIKAKEAEITKYKELDFKITVAAAEEATLRLELDNLKAKNADLEAQIKQCKDDFLAFALNELRGKYDCVRTCITPIQGKVYTDSEYRDLITQYSGLVKPNGIIVQQLEKEITNLKAAATKRLIDADTMAQEHRRELEKANASLQAQVTAQSDDVKQAINNAERVKELEQLLLRARAEMQTKELIIQGERDQFTDEKAEMETRLATAKRLIDEAGGNPNHIHLAGNEVYLKIKDYMQHEPLWQDQTQHMLKHTLSLFGISYQAFQQKTHAKENQRLNSKIMGLEANINRHTAVVENLQQQLTASKKHASSLQCAIDGYNIERLRTGWQVAPTYVPGVNQVVAANIVAALKDVHAMAKAAKLEADQILAKYAKVEKIEERVETATNELKYHRNKACREHNNDAYLALTYVHNLLHPHHCLS